MSSTFPSKGIQKEFQSVDGADGSAISSTQTVPADHYGIIYKLWVAIDVASEADMDAVVARIPITVTMGSSVWRTSVHPEITDGSATEIRWMDLGPWEFDFGLDGFYSGVKGDNVVVTVGAAGTGIGIELNYIYSK